jgi:hypothetical protein
MIIVEGPDGGGKTTMCKMLAEYFGTEVFHAGGPVKYLEELDTRIDIQLGEYGSIVDRCSIFSEPIYGTILRKRSLMGLTEFERWIEYLKSHHWGIVYCKAKGKIETGKTWKTKQHMKKVNKQKDKIREMYGDIMVYTMDELGLPVVSVNCFVHKKDISKVAWLADRRRKLEHRTWIRRDPICVD